MHHSGRTTLLSHSPLPDFPEGYFDIVGEDSQALN